MKVQRAGILARIHARRQTQAQQAPSARAISSLAVRIPALPLLRVVRCKMRAGPAETLQRRQASPGPTLLFKRIKERVRCSACFVPTGESQKARDMAPQCQNKTESARSGCRARNRTICRRSPAAAGAVPQFRLGGAGEIDHVIRRRRGGARGCAGRCGTAGRRAAFAEVHRLRHAGAQHRLALRCVSHGLRCAVLWSVPQEPYGYVTGAAASAGTGATQWHETVAMYRVLGMTDSYVLKFCKSEWHRMVSISTSMRTL